MKSFHQSFLGTQSLNVLADGLADLVVSCGSRESLFHTAWLDPFDNVPLGLFRIVIGWKCEGRVGGMLLVHMI